jgi:glycosyltransferase involved in cell wall biosynthesis
MLKTILGNALRAVRTGRGSEVGGWVSWDPHPWKHPWLTSNNLGRMKAFSQDFLERERRSLERIDPRDLRIGFCGNIANCMYVRAVPLRKAGMDVSIHIHPDDQYVMSHPIWEEYDGLAPDGDLTIDNLVSSVSDLPHVREVFIRPRESDEDRAGELAQSFMREDDIVQFPSYLGLVGTLADLQDKDVLWGTQTAYLAYLANRPYVISQSGGDFWFEASRDDEMGAITRRSFGQARINLASNPWVFAHARRYGLNNVVYLPKMIDQEVYSPGQGASRARWEAETGGRFFVLTSSRLDERNKGSSIGIEGFAAFSRDHPDARLVMFGWGSDRDALERRLDELGIRDRVLALPVSGKARLRENLRSADVFMDQFVLGYFGSAGMEAMACGLPVIARYELEQYEALCETGAPPVLNAGTAEEVAEHLRRLHGNVDLRRDKAERTRMWFVANHGSERWLQDHQAVLAATALKCPADYRNSPLAEELSEEERDYCQRGLLAAPTYPNYGY